MVLRLKKVSYTQAKGEGLSLNELVSESFRDILNKHVGDEFEAEVRSISLALIPKGLRVAEGVAPGELFLLFEHRSHEDQLENKVYIMTEDERVLERVLRALGPGEERPKSSRGT